MSSKLSSERGAILIQVAVASIVLIAFSMFIVDYGVMWVSRSQAQNAADSGALAGAVALAFDDFDDHTAAGPAKQAALRFALLNKVFGEDPDVQVNTDVIFYSDDPTKFPAECSNDSCIRVDVYRTDKGGRSNPLPMMFGQLVGLSDQGVRATATAKAAGGNAALCVKPWVVADRWDENADGDDDYMTGPITWSESSSFDPVTDLDDGFPDSYVQRTADEFGTGFGQARDDGTLLDYGYQFILRTGNYGSGEIGLTSSGWVMTVSLPPNPELGISGGGTPETAANISDCTAATVAIADPSEQCTEASSTEPDEDGNIIMPCLDVKTGAAWTPLEDDLEAWIGAESMDDMWLKNGANGGVGEPSRSGSGRIIPLALFDPQHYANGVENGGFNGTNGVVRVVNVLGFFVEGTCDGGGAFGSFFQESYLPCSTNGQNNDLVGRLVSIPGQQVGAGDVGPGAFVYVIRLIR